MSEIVFLADIAIGRDHFEALPIILADAGGIAEAVRRRGGQLCRAMLDRDGSAAWHALAYLHLNGTTRVAAARVKLGRYQSED